MIYADFYEAQRGTLATKARPVGRSIAEQGPSSPPVLSDEARAGWDSAMREGRVTKWTLQSLAASVDAASGSGWWSGVSTERGR